MTDPILAAYEELAQFFIERAEASGYPISPIFGHGRNVSESRQLYFEIFGARALQISWRPRQSTREKFEHYVTNVEFSEQEMPMLVVNLYYWPFDLNWLWEVRDKWMRVRVSQSDMTEFLAPR